MARWKKPLHNYLRTKAMADEIVARSDSTFTPAPEGEFDAVCADVIDLGMVENKKFSKLEHKVALVFQLGDSDEKGKRYEIAQRFTISMHEKALLRKFLSQWRGKSYGEDEVKAGVPLHKLEGQPAIITVEHQTVNGKTYANILNIRLPRKDDPRIKAEGYVRSEYWKKLKQAQQQEPTDEELYDADFNEEAVPF
jgi:hypothetical protein